MLYSKFALCSENFVVMLLPTILLLESSGVLYQIFQLFEFLAQITVSVE